MFKFLVFFGAVAAASANGLIGSWGSPLVGAPLVRSSLIGSSLIGSSLIGSPLVGAPVVSAYSGISSWGASPLVSNLGVAPVVSAYSAVPAVVAASEPALAPGVPAIVTKPTGKLVDTLDVVVNRNNHLVAKSLAAHGIQKRSAVAPLAVATPLAASWASPVAASWAAPVATPLAASWGAPVAAPLAASWGAPLATSWGVSSPIAARTIVSPIGGLRAW